MDNRTSVALAVGLLSGCSWVSLAPEAKAVRVFTSEAQASDCRRVGETTVSLLDRVAGIRRDAEKVQNELNTLARNSAAKDLGGDAVLPVGKVEEGRQTFVVFRCSR